MTAPPATDTALAADLLGVVARIKRAADQRVRTRLSDALTRQLSAIGKHGPARMSDLATLDHCSRPNMTRQVRLLEDEGLVSRTTDSADARVVLISITAKGHSVLAQVHADHRAASDQRLARLDDADRQTLAQAVRITRSLLDDAERHR